MQQQEYVLLYLRIRKRVLAKGLQSIYGVTRDERKDVDVIEE